jgi:hypothetical protein
MDNPADTLDQADEDILTYTISDEALEAAAGQELIEIELAQQWWRGLLEHGGSRCITRVGVAFNPDVTHCVSLRQAVACFHMVSIPSTCSAGAHRTSIVFSKAPSRPTCPCSNRPTTSW